MELTHIPEAALLMEGNPVSIETANDAHHNAKAASQELTLKMTNAYSNESSHGTAEPQPQGTEADNPIPHQPPPLSKSQLKKLKRQQMWEERKDDRKRLRKEKRHELQARKRAERAARIAEAEAAGLDPKAVIEAGRPARLTRQAVPVTIILDCDFERYMSDKELSSLSSQVVRSYSEVRASRYQAHLVISSWNGKLRERYETVLNNHHRGWKGARFLEGDFVQAGREAFELMRGPRGGALNEVLRQATEEGPRQEKDDVQPAGEEGSDPTPLAPEPDSGAADTAAADSSIVYLTSDSPHTLDRLEPYASYVIGGIVDKNREKGLCLKRATERGMRTAKLPIGEYMVMSSRKVLTTNQVVEIMARWLEGGDWQAAFQQVIPKRKGGVFKSSEDAFDADQDEDGDEYDSDDR